MAEIAGPGEIAGPVEEAPPPRPARLPSNLRHLGHPDTIQWAGEDRIADLHATRTQIEHLLAEYGKRWDGEAARALVKGIARWWRP